MTKSRGLGKGLDALFPSGFTATDVTKTNNNSVQEISIKDIQARENQPRTRFNDETIEHLALSIKEHGVLQPIIVFEEAVGQYRIVAGERRYRAALRAGLETIPAQVRTVNELQQLEMALVENIQREDLDPIDQAVSLKRLHEEFSQSYEAIAKRIGKAETTVVNLIRLLKLPAPYQAVIQQGGMSEGHARALLALEKRPELQQMLFQHIMNDHWSVRKAELFVAAHKDGQEAHHTSARKHLLEETKETKIIGRRLESAVRIKRRAKGGMITIAFKSDDDLERLLDELQRL